MKLTLEDLTNLNNQQSAVETVNRNNTDIEEALENTLSRDGTSPNSMEADLDMNSQRILNLPAPRLPEEPVRLADIGGGVSFSSLDFSSTIYTWDRT
jgi:hypothetical protein